MKPITGGCDDAQEYDAIRVDRFRACSLGFVRAEMENHGLSDTWHVSRLSRRVGVLGLQRIACLLQDERPAKTTAAPDHPKSIRRTPSAASPSRGTAPSLAIKMR